MAFLKKIVQELNVPAQCAKYHVPLWQCPQFLFVIMGLAIGIFAVLSYVISVYYEVDAQTAAFAVLIMSGVLLIITYTIVQGFEKVAEASRMKTEFISIVSHQLRTPITNMRWSVDMLLSGRLDNIALSEKHQEYFKIINQNIGRMNDLVQDLLMVSRLEQGRLPLKLEAIDLVEFVREMVKRFEPTAQAAKVTLILSTNPSPEVKPGTNPTNNSNRPRVLADASQLKIILENFISNAIRYSKSGGTVNVDIKQKNKEAQVLVKDEGIGIPQEDQKFIGQKFFRAENARTHQPQGTGLGLSVSRALLERLGGKMGFKSQENKGSTFWFTLPIKS